MTLKCSRTIPVLHYDFLYRKQWNSLARLFHAIRALVIVIPHLKENRNLHYIIFIKKHSHFLTENNCYIGSHINTLPCQINALRALQSRTYKIIHKRGFSKIFICLLQLDISKLFTYECCMPTHSIPNSRFVDNHIALPARSSNRYSDAWNPKNLEVKLHFFYYYWRGKFNLIRLDKTYSTHRATKCLR